MCVSVMQHSMTQARSRLDSGVTLGIVKTGLCLSILVYLLDWSLYFLHFLFLFLLFLHADALVLFFSALLLLASLSSFFFGYVPSRSFSMSCSLSWSRGSLLFPGWFRGDVLCRIWVGADATVRNEFF